MSRHRDEVPECISSAKDLWWALRKTLDVNSPEYDRSFLEDIQAHLAIPANMSVENFLIRKNISVEQLLAVILEATEPFSQMMVDLLNMFEMAGAQTSDHNLCIQFDFEDAKNRFALDLSHFRKEIAIVQTLQRPMDIYNPKDVWIMRSHLRNCDIFKCMNKLPIEDESIAQWCTQYWGQDVWPDSFPNQPLSGIAEIDRQVSLLWAMLALVVRKLQNTYDSSLGRRDSLIKNLDKCRNQEVFCAELDCWTCSMIESIALRIQNLNHVSEGEKPEAVEKFDTDLKKAIGLLDCQAIVIEETVKALQEILNLPTWKKRHELYSVWVCTQIVDSLKEFDVKFHVEGGKLSFSFAGSHIATCNGLEPPLHLWAELNTPYATPISKHRSGHIQPDYSLVVGNPKDPKNSVAVVECKQYKRYSRKNFLEAVTDYARGRPNAHVLLVNYNVIPEKVKAELEKDVKPRVPFFDRLKPLTCDGSYFQVALKESVLSWYGIVGRISAPFDITLSWGRKPRDLDLYLKITEPSGAVSWVNYRTPRKYVKTAEMVLDHDDRDGYGKETISVSKLIDARYDVFVHNFSGEIDFDNEVNVSIQDGNRSLRIYPNAEFALNTYWYVCQINLENVLVINRLQEGIYLSEIKF